MADGEIVREWIALSLFGAGFRTDAARLVRELGTDGTRPPLHDVASRLYPDPGERRREVDRAHEAAERALRESRVRGDRALTLADPDYPPQLREIVDPPPVLWVSGDAAILSKPAIGVVGSRDAVPASLAVARRLGCELSEAGLVVVSGLARGVDGAAHAGALAGTGKTVAVMGSGLDVVYPAQHKHLAAQVSQTGAVVSELPPWVKPVGRHFPLRNRIISGLSRAILVVEASEHSGSLITARLASEQGRDVLAVPGGVLSGRHRGSNALIKDGARLVETVNDVLAEIGWTQVATANGASNLLPINILESRMAAGEHYTVEQLADRIGRSAAETMVELSHLELAGRVVRMTGGQFVLIASDARRQRTSRASEPPERSGA
ncbi:MAG TPA: DNA-processing protein DprA [Vicinamibacterales bacterium]|nr:DNA-processing protein DprA [Vicinamibacterales bacterium]